MKERSVDRNAHAVNVEEHNPTACALINILFLRGSQLETARHGDAAFEIVRILVVGIDTESGIQWPQWSRHAAYLQ